MENESQLARELVDLAMVVKNITRHEMKNDGSGQGLTLSQLRLLSQIRNGIRHVGQLAQAFGISQPATSNMVNGLVNTGFIERVPHPTDRRQIELHLTSKAKVNLKSGYKRAFLKIDEKLNGLSNSKKAAMIAHLRELARLLADADPGVES